MNTEIQKLAREARTAREQHGRTSNIADDAMLALLDATDKRTLDDQAAEAEGQPIPADRVVRVELVDGHGNVVEYQDLRGSDSADELATWAGNYVQCLVAEAMAGEVRWYSIDQGETT